MAPWTHTYLSPQTERRLCCASREPAQNFEQYIDTSAGTGKYIPVTLDQHWNSEHMRECTSSYDGRRNTFGMRRVQQQIAKH
jgi:hypothetical protein